MADPFIGEIRAFGFNFAPYQWAFCDGASIPIQQNPALFSILGINYGGDGTSKFCLPNLQGRAVVGAIDGQVNMPEGAISIALAEQEMPAHSHTIKATFNQSKQTSPGARLVSKFSTTASAFVTYPAAPQPALTGLSAAAVNQVGGGASHENRQPFQVMNFCISLYGDWPQQP